MKPVTPEEFDSLVNQFTEGIQGTPVTMTAEQIRAEVNRLCQAFSHPDRTEDDWCCEEDDGPLAEFLAENERSAFEKVKACFEGTSSWYAPTDQRFSDLVAKLEKDHGPIKEIAESPFIALDQWFLIDGALAVAPLYKINPDAFVMTKEDRPWWYQYV